MRKNRRMFLFGAGSVLEWNAPKTSELTNLILESGYKTCSNTTTITRFIYNKLLENGYDDKELNFEGIISVIEEFVVYYSSFSSSQIPSLLRCFFDSKCEEEILNFSIEGGEAKHGYRLEIPKGVRDDYAKYSLQNETPAQFFFEHLIGELLTEICNRVIHYSYHSKQYSAWDLNSNYSISFVEWMKLHAKQTPLRLYTLNYDRVFKILLEENKVHVFEGFDDEKMLNDQRAVRPNIGRILTDFNAHVCYNLHGNVYWNVEDLDHHQLPNAEVLFNEYPNLPGNNTPASLQIEKGKTLMVTNIVTGYQKAQKSMITPFKQMQAAFDIDCFKADEIYIIGYSFGDEHINSSLRTALRHNEHLKLIIVDPFFMSNRLDEEVGIKLFSATGRNFFRHQKIDANVHSYMAGTFLVYSMSFKEFRERQLNSFNKAAGGIIMP